MEYAFFGRFLQGTTLRRYFEKVAAHHGLNFKAEEYTVAEDPGTHDEATLYVTHLREPVSRSISHFKCKIALWLLFVSIVAIPQIDSLRRFCFSFRFVPFAGTKTKAGGSVKT
jgi:hypothetical protein